MCIALLKTVCCLWGREGVRTIPHNPRQALQRAHVCYDGEVYLLHGTRMTPDCRAHGARCKAPRRLTLTQNLASLVQKRRSQAQNMSMPAPTVAPAHQVSHVVAVCRVPGAVQQPTPLGAQAAYSSETLKQKGGMWMLRCLTMSCCNDGPAAPLQCCERALQDPHRLMGM